MVFDKVYERIQKKNLKDISLIGVIGNQGAGKTHFNQELSEYLSHRGISSMEWNCDIYTLYTRDKKRELIKQLRGNDPNWVEKVFATYRKDLALEHLKNLKSKRSFSTNGLYSQTSGDLNLNLNVGFNDSEIQIAYDSLKKTCNSPICFLLDSDFIAEERFRENLDLIFYMQASREIRMQRVRERCRKLTKPFELDSQLFLEADKWLESYFRRQNTPKPSDIIIDNEDFNNRRIISL